jgi:hypothetical protein
MKTALLSVCYVIVLFVALTVLNVTFAWCLNTFVLDILNWFNGLHWLVKALVLMFGGGLLFSITLGIYEFLVRIVAAYVFSFFPQNWFTLGALIIFSLLNIANLVYVLWSVIHHWDFWVVIEFIMLVGFVVTIHSAFFPSRSEQEQPDPALTSLNE